MSFKSPLRMFPGIRMRHELAMESAMTYAEKVLSYDPIAYWPLWEKSGTVAECLVNPAQNGTYNRDVSLMGTVDGIGDGNTAPVFTPPNDRVDVYSIPFAAAFDTAEGTVSGWALIDAGAWTDGVTRCSIQLGTNGTNYVRSDKRNLNNRLRFNYVAGGVVETIDQVFSVTEWFHYLFRWSKTADEFEAYINGVQFGATQVGLGNWVGVLNNQRCVIGAANVVGTNPSDASFAHIAVFDRYMILG